VSDETTNIEAIPRRRWGRVSIGWILLSVSILGVVGLAALPAPYVIQTPGPVFNTLGSVDDGEGDDVPLISVSGVETFETSGELSLLTVYVAGSPENHPSWLEVIVSWFRADYAVIPMDLIFPPGSSQESESEQASLQMDNSQQEAIAAALTELDIPFESHVVVAEAVKDFPADGKLEPGDLILTAAGEPAANVSDLRARIKEIGIGGVIELTIERDGTVKTVALDIVASDTDDETPVIGVYTRGNYTFPFDVDIQISNVGGSSAGMMFALGIIDELTPGFLNGGENIAGTGEITAAGKVGPIGGIVQKAFGARDSGAEWLLVPIDNCEALVGHIPDGLRDIAVTTLDDAVAALKAISTGTGVESLPHCSAP
jgi:PDZ domain-containing protein